MFPDWGMESRQFLWLSWWLSYKYSQAPGKVFFLERGFGKYVHLYWPWLSGCRMYYWGRQALGICLFSWKRAWFYEKPPSLNLRERPLGLIQHVLTVLLFWSWALLWSRFHLRLRASDCSLGLAFCFLAPWAIAWILPAAPLTTCAKTAHGFRAQGGKETRELGTTAHAMLSCLLAMISQPQSITQKGVHAHLLTAREREHWFLQRLSHFRAANCGRQ